VIINGRREEKVNETIRELEKQTPFNCKSIIHSSLSQVSSYIWTEIESLKPSVPIIAASLIAEGAAVIINGRREEKVNETIRELEKQTPPSSLSTANPSSIPPYRKSLLIYGQKSKA
jgi:hypothetical protein